MKTIRCKMKCTETSQFENGHSSKFMAVQDGTEENKNFFKWTPSASMELRVTNEQPFVPGKQYYIDIVLAE